FCEQCCPHRHFSLSIEDEIVAADVHSGLYAAGVQQVGQLSFGTAGSPIVVTDEVLEIELTGCPECAQGADGNPIFNALEVVPVGFEICDEEGAGLCPRLSAFVAVGQEDGTVSLTWQNQTPFCDPAAEGISLMVLRDGEIIAELPGAATEYVDTEPTSRIHSYEVVAEGCAALSARITIPAIEFDVPLRINMGYPTDLVDSLGRTWIGDGGGAGDFLQIRPDDSGGANTAVNWCPPTTQFVPDSLGAFGLDPFHPNDQAIFDTIRWDDGATGADFRLEIPVPNGEYTVTTYHTECCCPQRHYKIEVQGTIRVEDASAAAYSASGELGRTGRFIFHEVSVEDGVLRLAFLPCDDCVPVGELLDRNAIVDAIEIVPSDEFVEEICPSNLVCSLDGEDSVRLAWEPPVNVAIS